MSNKPKHKIVKRSVKHTFTDQDHRQLGGDLARAIQEHRQVEAEFDQIKASFKAKTTAAEATIDKVSTDIANGFEYQDKPCIVIFDIPNGKKNFFLESDLDGSGQLPADSIPVITDNLTDADRQQELLDAESVFDAKEDIELFKAAGQDAGLLTIGRLENKWYAALRVKIGSRVLTERLDGEQPATKKRPDAVRRAVKRFAEWVGENLGVEASKGFVNDANLAIVAHAEREE